MIGRLTLALFVLALVAPAQDLVVGARAQVVQRDRALMNRLRNTTLSIDWKDTSLRQAVAELRTFTGLNIVVSAAAAEADALIPDLSLRRVSPLLLLRLIAEETDLTIGFRRNLVVLRTPAEAVRVTAVVSVYDLRSRFYSPPDFPGPKIGIRGSGVEIEEHRARAIYRDPPDFERIIEILRSATGEQNWEIEGVSMEATSSRLIVRHTPAMQKRVHRLLNALSAAL